MRKLIYTINVTIDGCCDHTKMVPDEEVLGCRETVVTGCESTGEITIKTC